MITGYVRGLEGRVRLLVEGEEQEAHEVVVVIDTGYTGDLALPPESIAALGLAWKGYRRGMLADGSECWLQAYRAEVMWDGERRRVIVDKMAGDPLMGMSLLSGYELRMQVRHGGKVVIKRLPKKRS